jgi:H+/Cl- antiporter ClcA
MKEKGDFTAEVRLVWISGLAVIIGAVCAYVALGLLRLICFFTNFFFFQHFSFQPNEPWHTSLGPLMILVPVVGGLIIGFLARYGSERIRGHGIPEAIEAILIGRSRMSPRVAVLKPRAKTVEEEAKRERFIRLRRRNSRHQVPKADGRRTPLVLRPLKYLFGRRVAK